MGQCPVEKWGPNPLSEMIEEACRQAFREEFKTGNTRSKRLMTIPEAAAYLDLLPTDIKNLMASGTFPVIRRGKAVRLDVEDLDEWVRTQQKLKRLADHFARQVHGKFR